MTPISLKTSIQENHSLQDAVGPLFAWVLWVWLWRSIQWKCLKVAIWTLDPDRPQALGINSPHGWRQDEQGGSYLSPHPEPVWAGKEPSPSFETEITFYERSFVAAFKKRDLTGAPPCWGLVRTQRSKWRLINRHPKQWLKPWTISKEAHYGDSTIKTSAHVASLSCRRLDQALYKSPYQASLLHPHPLLRLVDDQVSGDVCVLSLPFCSVSGRLLFSSSTGLYFLLIFDVVCHFLGFSNHAVYSI